MASLIVTIFNTTPHIPIVDTSEFPIQTIIHQYLFQPQAVPVTNNRSFKETVNYLKSKCDQTQSSVWIKQLALPLIFRIRDDTFKSTTLNEAVFVKNKTKIKRIYHYFELFDATDKEFKKPLVLIRTDSVGEICELSSINKGAVLNGNKNKEISDRIYAYLKGHFSFTNDESALPLSIDPSYLNSNEFPELHLKAFLGVASENGDTWYEQNNYYLTDFTNERTFFPRKKEFMFATQSTTYYYAALEKLRNTKIAELYNNVFFISYENTRKSLIRLAQKYLGFMETDENQKIYFGDTTIHGLGKLLSEASKKENRDPTIDYDLLDFQRMFLTPYEYPHEIDKTLSDFNLAIDVIWRHFIWVKDFTKTDRPISYKAFIAAPHETFDQMVSSLSKPNGVLWDDVIEEKLRQPNLKRPFSFVEDTDPLPATKKLRSIQEETSTEEVPKYASPEQFAEELKYNVGFIRRTARSKPFWKTWISIPQEWNGNPNQQATHLYLDFKRFASNGLQLSIRELKDDNASEMEIETKPILLNVSLTEYARLDDYIQPGEHVDMIALKNVVKIIAGSLILQ